MRAGGEIGMGQERIVRLALLGAAAATTVTLLVLIWIGTYSRLIADDFCTSADVVQHGVAGAVAHWYRSWSGRFSYHVVTSLAAAIGPFTTRLLPGLTVIALAASSTFAAKRVTGTSSLAAIAIGLAVTWSILGCAPDIFQVLFWASGVTTYSLPIIFIAMWIGLSLSSAHPPPAVHLLLFVAAGFSETVTAVLAGVLGLALLSWPAKRRVLAAGLTAVVAGGILMVAAPGNANRAARFARPEGSGPALVTLDASELIHVEALIAGLSMLLVFAVCACTGSSMRTTDRVRPGGVAATALAVIWSVVVPLLMARIIIAAPAPLRSLQPTHAVLVGAFAVAGWQLGRRWSRAATAAAIATLLLIVPVFSDLRELSSLAGGAAVFAREWDVMNHDLRSKRGESAVVVQAPAKVGRLEFVDPSPSHWTNRCMARHYGIGQITGR